MSKRLILLVNTGSRSCKLSLCSANGELRERWVLEEPESFIPPSEWLPKLGSPVQMTVHRLVHGGDVVLEPTRWSTDIDAALDPFDALAPLHNPQARLWARACAHQWPDAMHYFIPDSGFFSQLPAIARTLPLPLHMRRSSKLSRHGFHGLAHHSLWQQLDQQDPLAQGRVITLQLGGGCSAAALRKGKPFDTSMGYTPLSGLVMATRPGDLDPGVLLHLLQTGMSADDIEHALTYEAGLKGLSGISGDMRDLLAANTLESRFAIDHFCYRICQYVGAYTATLGGLDVLVFSGGIGENSAAIRRQVCDGLGFLGIRLDSRMEDAQSAASCVSSAESNVAVWVIRGNEETEMLRLALPFMRSS